MGNVLETDLILIWHIRDCFLLLCRGIGVLHFYSHFMYSFLLSSINVYLFRIADKIKLWTILAKSILAPNHILCNISFENNKFPKFGPWCTLSQFPFGSCFPGVLLNSF